VVNKHTGNFIPHKQISYLLQDRSEPSLHEVQKIAEKSLAKNRLEPEEVAVLLHCKSGENRQLIKDSAARLKKEIYGNRIVLFAPLYIGNKCINDCSYCGFRSSNSQMSRKTLTSDEVFAEVEAITKMGHKRIIAVFGEHNDYSGAYIADVVAKIYEAGKSLPGSQEIRRININAAPLPDDDFVMLKKAGIGTYQIFQESYDRDAYEKYHPRGPKSDWLYRLNSLGRAIDVGLDDVGIGALFGLADWRYEVLGLLYHTIHLEKVCGVGPHTISFPRIEPAANTPFTEQLPKMVDDELFILLVAILRLAVPYTGMIATCREDAEMRDILLDLGVSQIDAGSSIELKSYSKSHEDHGQFELADNRSLAEVTEQLISQGSIPSFCTACYRLGRTGEHFMEFAIPGFVKRFCTPNAILTFSEYLQDFADEDLKIKGERLIQDELEKMQDAKMRQKVEERLRQVELGKRDLLF